jgi:hypothetical protein
MTEEFLDRSGLGIFPTAADVSGFGDPVNVTRKRGALTLDAIRETF